MILWPNKLFSVKGDSVKLIKLLIASMLLIGKPSMASDYKHDDVYLELRAQVLSLTTDQIDTKLPVLAVLMETGYSEAVVTLVSVADGSTSLYNSNGGGIIGAGEYKQVHDSSIALVNIAAKNRAKFALTKDYPLPKNGFIRFYVVTPSGVYTEEVLEDDLGNERHELSPVFFQAHELISYIRVADEHRNTKQSSRTDR